VRAPLDRRPATVWFTSAALIATCLAAVLASPALMVRRVEVAGLAGLTPYEAQRTLEAARPVRPVHLARLEARSAFPDLACLPWVRTVSVRRRPPGTLTIVVTPRSPAACVCTTRGCWAVDGDGNPIRPGVTPAVPAITWEPDGLAPEKASADPTLRSALEVARWVRNVPAVVSPKIVVDRNRELCLNTGDGLTVLLGQADDLDAKLESLERVYRAEPSVSAKLLSIDLRTVEVPVCTPRSPEMETPASRPATELPRPSGRG